jgi:hypothetical protein
MYFAPWCGIYIKGGWLNFARTRPIRRFWGILIALIALIGLSPSRMKRLAWLFLAVICTALAQVQPVDGLANQTKTCGCCQVPGACGMPGCCQQPRSLPTACSSSQSERVARLPAVRRPQPGRIAEENFYALFVEPVSVRLRLAASAEAAPAADVPLFKAHCSFLI